MKQMSLSQVCNLFGFTRKVIQGYEKEGLIKHIGKNKYGHLMYDEEQIIKIAFIRYLQRSGLMLREISLCVNSKPNLLIFAELLKRSNERFEQRINTMNNLISKNKNILKICSESSDSVENEKKVLEIIMEELTNEKNI